MKYMHIHRFISSAFSHDSFLMLQNEKNYQDSEKCLTYANCYFLIFLRHDNLIPGINSNNKTSRGISKDVDPASWLRNSMYKYS